MSVRAKFQVTKIEKNYYRSHDGTVVQNGTYIRLTPMYDTSIPEDKRFFDATPQGEFWMLVNNPTAIDYLKPGHDFYIDLTEASVTK